MYKKKIVLIVIRDFIVAIIVAVIVYLVLEGSGSLLSMKDIQTNLREQIKSDKTINFATLDLNEAYKKDFESFIAGTDINNYTAIKFLDTAKDKFPQKIDLSKVFVHQKMLTIIFALLSGLIGYIFISFFNIYWFRLKTINILNNFSSVLESPLSKSLTEIVPKYFHNTVSEFSESHSIIIQGTTENYPYDFVKTISNWKSRQNNTKSGVEILTQCDVYEYNDLALKLLMDSKHSIYSTTFFNTEDFLMLLSSQKKEDNLLNWLKASNDRNQELDSFEIKRVHIIDKNDDFVSIYNNPKTKPMIQAINNYDKFYRDIDGLANINYNLYILGISNSNNRDGEKRKIYPPKFFGEYIIFDSQILLKYDDDFQVLEIYFGAFVETFVESFINKNSNNFQNHLLRKVKL